MTQIIIFLSLLILSGFFSSSETAFTSLTIYQIEDMEKKKGFRGQWIKHLSSRTDIMLTTLLIGNNLVNIGASALATSMAINQWGNWAIGYTTGGLTLVVLIFCEVTPKQLALEHNETVALFSVLTIWVLSYIFRPLIWVISGISNLISSLFSKGEKRRLTLDNLLHMVNVGKDMGIVEDYENQMVRKVFRINDTPVQAIMTHRKNVYCLDKKSSVLSVYEEIIEAGRSRIPVYDKNPENIVGIVNIHDILRAVIHGDSSAHVLKLKDLMIEPIFVLENMKVNELFNQFKQEKIKIAVILDEYGGLAGVVSQQDVIEEIFGSFSDREEEQSNDRIKPVGNNSWEILGDTDFNDIQDIIGLEIEHEKDTITIGGYLLDQFGEIPASGTTIQLNEGFYRIIEAKANRIVRVEFCRNLN